MRADHRGQPHDVPQGLRRHLGPLIAASPPGTTPVVVDGIPCYAPELASVNDGFPADRFARLYDAELRNFWYRSRARIIRGLVLPNLPEDAQFLEIGCGTGSLLEYLSRGTRLNVTGAEAYLDGLKRARARLPGSAFVQLDASRLPFESRFDGIGLFDVLEHLDDDEGALRGVHRALKPGGCVFATAPQHPGLWSANDEVAYHRRRYRRGELAAKVSAAGFDIVRETSFVTVLFPMLAAARLARRRPPAGDPYDAVLRELELPAPLNTALELLMRIDEGLIAAGARLPFGGSIAVVGRRRG